jgi:glutamyl-tRNA(Gln) amidotransferase subunit D
MFGYKGKALKALKAVRAKVGDRLRVEKLGQIHEGILMPRTELGDQNHLVIKLNSGYNLGVRLTRDVKVRKIAVGKAPGMGLPPIAFKPDPSKPNVSILGTGGTIASRVDYRTGAVYPAFTAEELYSAVPELANLANIKTSAVCSVFSENMSPQLWVKIARAAARAINGGARGVVIAHGTDTMGYTAAALSFALKGVFRPVVLVGSQRSSDRPSSDAALNLSSAVSVAGKSDIAEVCVVMHGSIEDDFCFIHRGTKVRKCHTSRRDTFQTINDLPIGMVKDGEIIQLSDYNKAKQDGKVVVDAKFEPRVVLVKVSPGIQPKTIDSLLRVGCRGIVLEGMGLGHTPEVLFPSIKRAIKRGVSVVMTSQCIWGRVDMKVYSTGRDLLQLGVIPGEDMLPEVAYVKLMWVLGHTRDMQEVSKLMLTNVAGEILPRTRLNAFQKVFGGV